MGASYSRTTVDERLSYAIDAIPLPGGEPAGESDHLIVKKAVSLARRLRLGGRRLSTRSRHPYIKNRQVRALPMAPLVLLARVSRAGIIALDSWIIGKYVPAVFPVHVPRFLREPRGVSTRFGQVHEHGHDGQAKSSDALHLWSEKRREQFMSILEVLVSQHQNLPIASITKYIIANGVESCLQTKLVA